ncbi:MAG: cyclic lactone autoinducer peptide [Oscillospiraceae bacterium]|nr:cyclic lactone autoinducer peptide [Oscillospiraceae bacterium]
MKEKFVHAAACCALLYATLLANLNCIMLLHQEEEPEEVRKLRKF